MRNILFLFIGLLVLSCEKGSELANRPPDTRLVVDAINLVGDDRLNSVVTLSWYGTDADGWVTGYELSIDGSTWGTVTTQDSTFRFNLAAGQDTANVELWVRAIDNEQAVDPTPAYLKIPIQNTPPQAAFNASQLPPDSALVAATVGLLVNDPDGDATLATVEVKFNNGQWYEVPKSTFLATFVLGNTPGEASVILGTSSTAQSMSIDGVLPNATNQLYLRASDIAGAYSPIDTLEFYFKTKSADLLVVCGQASSAKNIYLSILQNLSISYDLLDYYAGWDEVPHYWNPTFTQILAQYNKLFIFTDAATLSSPNPVTGEENNLMVFAAPAIQPFVDAGGKVLATMSFSNAFDPSPLYGALPIEGLVTSSGQARIMPDSGLYTVDAVNPSSYPNVFPNFVDFGVDPIVPSLDAEPFYRAKLTKLSGWNGDNLMGVRRRNGSNQINQVFFSVELHKYNLNATNLNNLFDQILNNDLDW